MSHIFALEAATTLTCQQIPAESANKMLMRKASEQRLPLPPTSGSGGTVTGMDRLVADIINLLRTAGLGFPVSFCDSEGTYIVLTRWDDQRPP